MERIPDELLVLIFLNVETYDLKKCPFVSQQWRRVVTDPWLVDLMGKKCKECQMWITINPIYKDEWCNMCRPLSAIRPLTDAEREFLRREEDQDEAWLDTRRAQLRASYMDSIVSRKTMRPPHYF